MLLGDQIYVDATYGILDPSSGIDHYTQAHRRWLKAVSQWPHFGELWTHSRVYMVPDDHEIQDNWEPHLSGDNHQILQEALEAFDTEPGEWVRPKRSPRGGYWGQVPIGGGQGAFMLDTRTTREPRPWGSPSQRSAPHILNKVQRDALEAWLNGLDAYDKKTGTILPKFITSQAWPLPRHIGNGPDPAMDDRNAARSDAWDGYPASLKWLLGFIADKAIRGVVILCGDAHLAGFTEVWLQKNGGPATTLRIVHAPALYAPFPFANAQPHHFRCADGLAWNVNEDIYTAKVKSELWPSLGDGFVQVEVSVGQSGKLWGVCARFNTTHNTSAGEQEQRCWCPAD